MILDLQGNLSSPVQYCHLVDVYSNFPKMYIHNILSKTASVWYNRGTTVKSSAYLDFEKGIKKDSQRLPWVYQIIFFLLNSIYNHYALSGIQLVCESEYPLPLACTYVIKRGDFSYLSPLYYPSVNLMNAPPPEPL